ncbi:MAG: hypothetical protein ACRC2T_18945, partial [Thermoguttaceae bacterium]
GTRVNGETVQLWILRPGDLISLGRSVILVGSKSEIGSRLTRIRADQKMGANDAVQMGSHTDDLRVLDNVFRASRSQIPTDSSRFESEIFPGLSPDDIAALHLLAPPPVPAELPPKQAAQLAELLQYIHIRLRFLADSVQPDNSVEQEKTPGSKNKRVGFDPSSEDTDGPARVSIDAAQWQNLLDFYEQLSVYLRSITEP